jgi:ferric-dicitrate binding protein FerR (iron transport regulator)
MMNDDLLVKYLLGETTDEEAAQVQAWTAEQPANARYYADFTLIWEESRKLARASKVNTDDAWARFQDRIAAEGKPKRIPLGKTAMGIAAGVAILIAGSMLYFLLNRSSEILVVRSGDAIQVLKLSDGTVVTLNRKSVFRYPEQFKGGQRDVSLEGEAFFEVAPDKARPFTITANEAQVSVVGTSFNVKSRDTATEVIVATGIVEVSRQQEAIRLLPNEAATVYQGRAGILKRKTDDQLYSYYRTHEFVCINTPLHRLADILSEAYNVRIEIPDPALRNLQLTVTFKDESLTEVLRVIEETLNIHATQTGDRIVFAPR